MGNVHPRLFGARRTLAVGGVLLVLVVIQVSGQDQCRLTAEDGMTYDDSPSPDIPDGLSFPNTGELRCQEPASDSNSICPRSSIEDCDKVTCDGGNSVSQVCLEAKIDNVKNLDCLSRLACQDAEVTDIQDGGFVKCGATFACTATFEAAEDAKFTLECDGDDLSCARASASGASDIACLTIQACLDAKFFNIPQDGNVECSDFACQNARMGVDDNDEPNVDNSGTFSVTCSDRRACESAKINARAGLVTCDGAGASEEPCRGSPTTNEPIEITARCLECKNGGCGANCLFNSEACPTSDGFYGDCTCVDPTDDLTNCELRDALESRIVELETRNDALETRIDEFETGIHAKLDEILNTCSPSPAPKSTKSGGN